MIDHSIFSIDMENVGLKVHRADLEVIYDHSQTSMI